MTDTPPDRIDLSVTTDEGQIEPRDAFMSYGLLNDLVRVVGDPNKASVIELDPELADVVVRLVLIPRSKTGKKMIDLTVFDPPGLTVGEAMKLFDWTKAHLLDFFTSRLGASLQSISDRKEKLAEIGSKVDGLKA